MVNQNSGSLPFKKRFTDHFAKQTSHLSYNSDEQSDEAEVKYNEKGHPTTGQITLQKKELQKYLKKSESNYSYLSR